MSKKLNRIWKKRQNNRGYRKIFRIVLLSWWYYIQSKHPIENETHRHHSEITKLVPEIEKHLKYVKESRKAE